MVLTLEQVNERLEKIPQQIAAITAEQHQLLGYKQALEDVEAEATPKNGEVMPPPKKEKKSKVAKAA
tara:strand:+ start:443 stop:643 length:201 start_codon:yes stop_codon:yes gene_type:complete